MSETVLRYSFLIPLAPLGAFVIILSLRKFIGLQGAWVGIVALLYGLIHSVIMAGGIFTGTIPLPSEGLQGHFFESTMTWFAVGVFDFRLGVLIDGLSSLMLVVVTLVSLLVQIYSVSYMHDHPRFGRYFAYINLFTFAMLILVVANDMLQLFIGWELVGLSSYLLIGFDVEREAAAYAGRKAFLTTRFGDVGMYLGLLTIFNYLGTFNIPLLQQTVKSVPHPQWVLALVPLLLFFGAMGKSAQVPFHVWLPDAMEGPTPASALIHAATMVAAGVYLVARVYFLFEASPLAMDVVAVIGVITALLAASMGLVASDIKRVLAFSTVSQLGFMMTALGCGGYEAGLFHLTTHAAFKALLFLCAGSVIHAVHTNDMWKMGGLKTQMPITAATYLIATLAISGCWPFAGFFSKEEVLAAAYQRSPILFALLGVVSLMTTFYMFRSWYLTFTGLPRDRERFHHAHESPLLMTAPLIILGVLSAVLGFALWYNGNITHWVHWGEPEEAHHGGPIILATSLLAFVLGLAGATWVYLSKPPAYESLAQTWRVPYKILVNKYKFDEFYLWLINKIYYPLANGFAKIDYNVVDQLFVDGVAQIGKGISWLIDVLDFNLIDKILVDGEGTIVSRLGARLRRLQSGLAQSYLFWMALGLGAMLVWMAHHFK